MFATFAHAGEAHYTGAETVYHFLQDWYIALPLFLLVLAGFMSIVYLASRRSMTVTYIATAGLLLLCGIFMYNVSTVISVASLTLGMAMMLVTVLLSLMAPGQTHKK